MLVLYMIFESFKVGIKHLNKIFFNLLHAEKTVREACALFI